MLRRGDRMTRVKDYTITFIISFLITALITPIPVKSWSLGWLSLKSFEFLTCILLIWIFYSYFFIPPIKPPEVPRRLDAFDREIIQADYNLFSTSTKEITLWKSPTFSYYLNLNILKNIAERSRGVEEVIFSEEPTNKQEFYENGCKLVQDIASKSVTNILTQFNALRIFIYPEKVYREKEKEIKSLILMQAAGGIHCIPIIREKLMDKITPEEKRKLQELSNRLSQKIEDEYTLVSRVERLLFKVKKDNAYSCSIPDFLFIDAFVRTKNSCIWWCKGEDPQRSTDENLFGLAEECLQILASVIARSWDDIIWKNYDHNLFTRVPVFVKIPIMTGFFSKNYYEKWLKEIVPKYSKLKMWIDEEENVLKEVVKKNRVTSVLDIGCGFGRHMRLLLNEGVKYCAGIDIEPFMIEKVKELYEIYGCERVFVQLESADQLLSFKDESFDMVICMTNTFGNLQPKGSKISSKKWDEYLAEVDKLRQKAISEIYRVLKRNGIFVLSVYKNTVDTKTLREQSYKDVGLRPYPINNHSVIITREGLYSKQFDLSEIEEHLKEAGFRKIDETKEVNNIAFIIIARK